MPAPQSYTVPKMKLYEMFAQKSTISSPQPSSINTMEASNSLPNNNTPSSYHNFNSPQMSNFLNPISSISGNDLIITKLEQLLVELDRLIKNSGVLSFTLLPPNHDIYLVMRQIPLLISQSTQPQQTMLTFVEKLVYMIYKSTSTFALETYIIFLQSLFDISPDTGKETLLWLLYADDERKFNASVIAMFIRSRLLPLEEFDIQLAKLIQINADIVVEFTIELLRICLLSPNPITNIEDHILSLSALKQQIKSDETSTRSVEFFQDLQQRVDDVYPNVKLHISCLELRLLLAEWNRMYQHPIVNDKLLQNIAKRILSATEDDNNRCFFLRMAIETCIQRYLSGKARSIYSIDALTKLVSLMVKLEPPKKQIKIISHTISVIVLTLAHYHENMGIQFNQKPFFRLLSFTFSDLLKLNIESVNSCILTCYCDALYTLQPLHVPGFAFSWLQLLSHRLLMPQLLMKSDKSGWKVYQKLVLCLLKFLTSLISKQVLPVSTKVFYRGTLRFLVLLLHDFPEFLCEYYLGFAQAIPHSCIQLRNIVLSAFPLVMHFPDPLTPDLKLSSLPECKQPPVITDSYTAILHDHQFDVKINQFIKHQQPSFYKDILQFIQPSSSSDNDDQTVIKEDVLNAFILYTATHTIDIPINKENPAIKLYSYLIHHMSAHGSYLILNAMCDHLRYPNNHTQFFSEVLLNLFRETPENIKEQITRILLERLIVNRPHPWGLLATFITLIKEPTFWEYSFVRSSPEIERLFDNVARSIKRLS
ncbi:CCR4-Not complex component, Not1-domain-containing protein [Cunninghamella echinulata]|nr:CCR4-Not complex component, Not1-domain-containing protein [Cunninghamella echinulata]